MLSALRVRGPYRGTSGYDHHVREFVREIARQGVLVELVDVPEWGSLRLPDRMLDPWFERLSDPLDTSLTLHFTMPHQVTTSDRSIDVNFSMFEATRVPLSWIDHNRHHSLVIVPTESSREAWINSGLSREQIRICPLGVNVDLFSRAAEPLSLQCSNGRTLAEFGTRFLNVSELGPRKNLIGLLRAWMQATRASDDAVLVIKLGTYSSAALDDFSRKVRRLQQDLGISLNDAAPVELYFDQLAPTEIPSLYAMATHYISMSHGEGWDNAMVEAAASGLRLIAPDHSAYRSYLTPLTARMIPSHEVKARFESDPALQVLFHGVNWWEPDTDAAVEAIRSAIAGHGDEPFGARETLLKHFNWPQSTRTLLGILSDLDSAAPQ
jgi:glycosyltransferase involved in cell wall biosynthesis